MTTRRCSHPMLYLQHAPVRWFRQITAIFDETAASLCQQQWHQARARTLQPVRLSLPARRG
jgi:hypothetical protein